MLTVAGQVPYSYSTSKAHSWASFIDDIYGHLLAELHVPEMRRLLLDAFSSRTISRDEIPAGTYEENPAVPATTEKGSPSGCDGHVTLGGPSLVSRRDVTVVAEELDPAVQQHCWW